MSGWFTLNSDLVQDLSSYKSKSNAANDSIVSGDKIINSSQYTPSSTKNSPQSSSAAKSSLDKRLDYMNTFLKNVFFSLSLNQANLDGMISIYELMKFVIRFTKFNLFLYVSYVLLFKKGLSRKRLIMLYKCFCRLYGTELFIIHFMFVAIRLSFLRYYIGSLF